MAERTELRVFVQKKLFIWGTICQTQPYWLTIVVCPANLCHQINIKPGCVELEVRRVFRSGEPPLTVSMTGDAFAHKTLRQQYLGIA